MKLKHLMHWFSRRAVFIVTALLLAVATLFVWFLVSGFSPDATLVSLGLAALSALFAAISSIASLQQAVEAQKQRESEERPYVITEFVGESNRLVYFVVQNYGNSPALNVRICFDPAPIDYAGRPLGEVSLFEKPISLLSPNRRFRQTIGVGHSVFADGKPTEFRVSVSYESVQGELFEDSTYHDLAYLKQATVPPRSVEDHLGTIGEDLDKLVKLFESVRSHNSILIESPAEHEARMRQLVAQYRMTPRWKLRLRAFLERILSMLT